MNTIVDQQLRFELAEDYSAQRTQTYKYAKGMLKWIKTHIGKNVSGQIHNNEGGLTGMVETILCYRVEKGDLQSAFDEYSRYLNHEYIIPVQKNNIPLSTVVGTLAYTDVVALATTDDVLASPSDDRSSEDATSSSSFDLAPGDETELFEVLANVKSHKEASEILGWELSKLKKVYKRVHYRRRYSEDEEYRQKRKNSSARYR